MRGMIGKGTLKGGGEEEEEDGAREEEGEDEEIFREMTTRGRRSRQ